MEFEFENRWHDIHELREKFKIKNKTMKNWMYDKKTGKKKDLKEMGLYKLPDTNYYVANAVTFQKFFNKQIGLKQ